MFTYDPGIPLDATQTQVETRAEISLHDLAYRANKTTAQVQSWLIVPRRSHSIPYVVLLHGGGQDRGACLAEGWLLAERGIGSLLVDLPHARTFPDFSDPFAIQDSFASTVIDVMRGLDYLAHRPGFDAGRGAIAGFSFGASIASAVASTANIPLKTAILTACVPRMSEFWRSSTDPTVVDIRRTLSPAQLAHFVEVTQSFDAIRFLPNCSGTPLFFQFGSEDECISAEQVQEFVPYAAEPNQLKVYDSATHLQMFFSTLARADRVSWLTSSLLT